MNPRVTYPNVACCFGGIFDCSCERTVLEDSCFRRKIEVGVRIFGGGVQRVDSCMRPVANWERNILTRHVTRKDRAMACIRNFRPLC